MISPVNPTKLEIWEAERILKWAWQHMMAVDQHSNKEEIYYVALALQSITKMRQSIYADHDKFVFDE